MNSKLAKNIISLLKDLAGGKLSEDWAQVTKSAVAEAILALTKMDDELRQPADCINTPTVSAALYNAIVRFLLVSCNRCLIVDVVYGVDNIFRGFIFRN